MMSAVAAKTAGPGFASAPLESDKVPVLAFWNRQFYTALCGDDPTNKENWKKCPLGDVSVGGQSGLLMDLSLDGRRGKVSCLIGSLKSDKVLNDGDMLVFDHTHTRVEILPIRPN